MSTGPQREAEKSVPQRRVEPFKNAFSTQVVQDLKRKDNPGLSSGKEMPRPRAVSSMGGGIEGAHSEQREPNTPGIKSVKSKLCADEDAYRNHIKARPFNGQWLSVLDLFAGIGTLGAALVLEGYGLRDYAAVEIDDEQRQILFHNMKKLKELYPDRVSEVQLDKIFRYGHDVRKLKVEALQHKVDLVGAGFTCTNWSKAITEDLRKGFFGHQSKVYFDLESFLLDLRRKDPNVCFILENVKNLKNKEFRSQYDRICTVWGEAMESEAAEVSWGRRGRLWWLVNCHYQETHPRTLPQLHLCDVLDVTHKPITSSFTDAFDQTGKPMERWMTQLTTDDTYSVRKGDAMVLDEKGIKVRPFVEELSRIHGWPPDTVDSAPVRAGAKVKGLGYSQDLNDARRIIRCCKFRTTTVPKGKRVRWVDDSHTDKHSPPEDSKKDPSEGRDGKDAQRDPSKIASTERNTQSSGSADNTPSGGEKDTADTQTRDAMRNFVQSSLEGELLVDKELIMAETNVMEVGILEKDDLDLNNYYEVLSDLEQEREDNSTAQTLGCPFGPIPLLRGTRGKQFHRVVREIRERFPKKGFCARVDNPLETSSAAAWKTWLAQRAPFYMFIPVPKISSVKATAIWNCISLERLRFQGKRETYLVIKSADQRRRILVLHVPPECLTEQAAQEHARRQATFGDDSLDVVARGRRIKLENWLDLDISPSQLDRLKHGEKLWLHTTPRSRRLKNYRSCVDDGNAARTEAELQRYLDKGWIEGPLHYWPWLVMPLGAVYLPEKDKFRLVFDSTRVGLTEASVPLHCKYDMLDDVLPKLEPNDWLSKLDFADAFFHWATRQEDADFQGLVSPVTNEVYRIRYSYFGGSQNPAVQQSWTHTIKKLVNAHGLKYCLPNTPESDYKKFEMVGGFVDDCMFRHAHCLTESQATEQFNSVVRFLSQDLGVEVKRVKDVLPCKRTDYVGIEIDTTEQWVSLTTKRADKYRVCVENFLQKYRAGDRVQRRDYAKLIGRLQWAAQVVPEGQQHLVPCYWSRDLYADFSLLEYNAKSAWNSDVQVLITQEAIDSLKWWLHNLQNIQRRSVYLERGSPIAGLWKGQNVKDTDTMLDSTSQTTEGVPVITTDASGYGGGAWHKHLRLTHRFTFKDGPKYRSSNWREMCMVVLAIEEWGHLWKGQRVLVRCDNSVTVQCIRKGRANKRTLYALFDRLTIACRKHNIDLGARHIRGEDNGLADALSRYRIRRDDSDWQFDVQEFDYLRKGLNLTFDVDACSSSGGENSLVSGSFWSKQDSCLEKDWSGLNVWCNPDFNMITEVLAHFKKCYSNNPGNSSGTFVLPAWFSKSYWRNLRGFKLVGFYPKGSKLFTSPNWWDSKVPQGEYPSSRIDRGLTRWDTVVVHCASALCNRGDKSSRSLETDRVERLRSLPTLRGTIADEMLLHKLRQSTVRRLWERA